MIHTFSKNKYTDGERCEKQISLTVFQMQYHRLSENLAISKFSEHHILFFVKSGNAVLNSAKIESGNIVYLSKFSKFNLTASKNTALIEITFDYSENIDLFNKNMHIFKFTPDIAEYITDIYENSHFFNSLPGVGEGLLLNVINRLNILSTSNSNDFNLYQKCREWIDRHSVDNINAQLAADAMQCSVAHLNRIVKKYSGYCLSDVIAKKRIWEIERLLKTHSTKDISDKLHFASPELLRKFFKYHTGLSLTEYKKTHL